MRRRYATGQTIVGDGGTVDLECVGGRSSQVALCPAAPSCSMRPTALRLVAEGTVMASVAAARSSTTIESSWVHRISEPESPASSLTAIARAR